MGHVSKSVGPTGTLSSLASGPYRSSSFQKPLIQTIVPLLDQNGRVTKSNYLAAWNHSGGNLPPNRLFHEYFALTRRWTQISGDCPMWAKELLVYPDKYDVFKSGADFSDPASGWTLKWEDIVKHLAASEFVNVTNAGLFVTPADFCLEDTKLIVIPESIVPIVGLSRGNARVHPSGCSEEWGHLDGSSLIPIQVLPGLFALLSFEERGYLQTTDLGAISPIVRGAYVSTERARSIMAIGSCVSDVAVATVELREAV
ncbi:hypothetical protein HY990_06620 [Candidatus Micrarchaeota archaeon]|nr:hypothetical protein [Candidatus Micrarchaeota archaeon]